jgi:SAM-dependent methyltransferase
VDDALKFRRDLYRGTARDYDRSRLPYPHSLIGDLVRRSGVAGRDRLLDLACGTGQVSFALVSHFGEVWAVDQEQEMIGVVREKAEIAGIGHIRAVTSAAEELSAPAGSFDLVAIGNAFHRLPRQIVAARVFGWLRPGRHLALLWGGNPWDGDAPWQRALSGTRDRWMTRTGARSRMPPGYDRDRRQRPDQAILRESGFQLAGSYRFAAACEWTSETLIGFAFSTSVLSRAALGSLAPEFASDLRRELRACDPSGRFRQTILFSYDLVRRPA